MKFECMISTYEARVQRVEFQQRH